MSGTTATYTGSMARYAQTALRQAMADAATELAEIAQQQSRAALGRRFTVRNPSIAKFIKRKAANTRTLTAQLLVQGPAGRRDVGAILARHEAGGVMRPDASPSGLLTRVVQGARRLIGRPVLQSPRFAVPTSAVKPGARSRVRKSDRPKALAEKGRDTFVGRDKSGDTVLFRRKYAKTKRETVEGLYVLKPTIRLRPRLQLEREAKTVMRRHAAAVFRKQMALSTARVAMRRGLIASSPLEAA